MASGEGAPRVTPVDKTSDRPAFKQIADDLGARSLRVAFRLVIAPSEAQLMAAYGVARMTVRQALAVLKAEGLPLAEHGRGVFVRASRSRRVRPIGSRAASVKVAKLPSSPRPREWEPQVSTSWKWV